MTRGLLGFTQYVFLLLQHTAYVGGEGNEIFNDIDFICILSGYH